MPRSASKKKSSALDDVPGAPEQIDELPVQAIARHVDQFQIDVKIIVLPCHPSRKQCVGLQLTGDVAKIDIMRSVLLNIDGGDDCQPADVVQTRNDRIGNREPE